MMLIHVSDIHFKEKHVGQPDDPNKGLRDDIIDDVESQREKKGCSADAILLSGDIAFAGKKKEYDFAKQWLEEKLCPAAGCDFRNIFVIPGNHDFNRDAAKAPVDVSAREQLRMLKGPTLNDRLSAYMHDERSAKTFFEPIENYNRFAAQFLCDLGPYRENNEKSLPFASRDLTLNDNSILRLWGFNSVLVSNDDDAANVMFIDPAAAQIEREKGVVHLVACHHPFEWLRNGRDFKDRIEKMAQIHVFGHEHDVRVEPTKRFVRIKAGALQPDRDEPGWHPGYNWIDVRVDGKGADRNLEVEISVRMYAANRFLALPNDEGEPTWKSTFKLPIWYPPAALSSEAVVAVPASSSENSSASMPQRTVPDIRTVTLKMFRLKVAEQRAVIEELGLTDPGDDKLKDYQIAVAAVRRSDEKGKLKELDAALTAAESPGKGI